MPVTLPIEVYEVFERSLGQDEAHLIVKALETVIEERTVYQWHETRYEIFERLVSREEFQEFKEEVATKKDLELVRGEISQLRTELMAEIGRVRTELMAEIEVRLLRLDRKFTVMFAVLFFTIIFLNQNALAFLAQLLGLIK